MKINIGSYNVEMTSHERQLIVDALHVIIRFPPNVLEETWTEEDWETANEIWSILNKVDRRSEVAHAGREG